MKILVTGATGLAGAEVVRQAILDADIKEITALVRKPLTDIQHAKLKTIIHSDFLNYAGLETIFKQHDACIWCLGISQTQVNKEQYIVITHDYALAAAQAMLQANPNMRFVFLSGAGADSSEQSRTLFAQIKGKTENTLLKLPFKMFFIARPGGIVPVHPNKNAPFAYKIFNPILPFWQGLQGHYYT